MNAQSALRAAGFVFVNGSWNQAGCMEDHCRLRIAMRGDNGRWQAGLDLPQRDDVEEAMNDYFEACPARKQLRKERGEHV